MSTGSPGTGRQPRVLDPAAFVVSIDTEMAWGMVHRQHEAYRYDRERDDLRRLIDLLDRYDLPATWAIVGHLMLEHCEPVDGVKHPEIIRPDFDWYDGDWFDADPCTNSDVDRAWYAPDVVDLIESAGADHEIACHGFSHIPAGDRGCSRETFESEIRAAAAVAASRGIVLRSLVHPRNQIGHVDVLVEHGIKAYRGRRSTPQGRPSPWQRLVDRTVGSERTAVRPVNEGEIWNLPATVMFDLDSRRSTWRLWIRQVERRLGQAVARRSLFHLWFHPHNLRDRPEESFAALERVCRAAARHRERGVLETTTMAALADRLSTEQRTG